MAEIKKEQADKFSILPDEVLAWLFSDQASKHNIEISESYKLNGEQSGILAKTTGQTILKEIKIENLLATLQENLKSSQAITQQIALAIAEKQFLPIRKFLTGTENLIKNLGGIIPAKLPEVSDFLKKEATTPVAEKEFHPTVNFINKPFRLAVQENKEILNQQLTEGPIKIAEFEQPVRPTIKNWLADYIKQKGTGHHDELERSDYLFKSANAANLPPEERVKLSKMLKAYDEDIEVPILSDTKLIDMVELMKKEAQKPPAAPAAPPAPKLTAPPTPPPAQPPQPSTPPAQTYSPPPVQPVPAPKPAAPPSPRTAGPDTYREKVTQEDLAGPIKPPTAPAAPKLDGNIIDLKNINE